MLYNISLTFTFFWTMWTDFWSSTSLVIHITENYGEVIVYIIEIISLNIETDNMKCLVIFESHKVWQKILYFEPTRLKSLLGFQLLKPYLASSMHRYFIDVSNLRVQRNKCIQIIHVCKCFQDLLIKVILYVDRVLLKMQLWDPVIFCSLLISI